MTKYFNLRLICFIKMIPIMPLGLTVKTQTVKDRSSVLKSLFARDREKEREFFARSERSSREKIVFLKWEYLKIAHFSAAQIISNWANIYLNHRSHRFCF